MKRTAVLATLFAVLCGGVGCARPILLGTEKLVVRPQVAMQSAEEVFGSQAQVTVGQYRLSGELLACEPLYLYLFLNVGGMNPYAVVPWEHVSKAVAVAAPPSSGRTGGFAAWLVVGSLSTASHGWWFMFSLPIWAAVGVPSTIIASRGSRVDGRCSDLIPYARYPQGLPLLMRPRFQLQPSVAAPWPLVPPPPPGAPNAWPAGGPTQAPGSSVEPWPQ